MRTKSQNGRRSRTKGHNFERWVVDQLQGIGIACERNIAQSRTAAREGCDVEGTDWWIECGCGATVDPRAKYAQAWSDWHRAPVSDVRPIVVITKRDRMEPLVTAAASELCAMYFEPVGRQMDGPLVTLRFADWLELVTPAQQPSAAPPQVGEINTEKATP
jgi:hypothetical protein